MPLARHRERDLKTASLRSRKLAHGSSARLERVSPTRESTEYGRVAAKTLLAGDLAPTKGRRRPDVRRGGPTYSALGKSGKRMPHGSFILCACFFGQSAVISYSQSMTLPLRPPSSISRCTELRHTAIERTMRHTREHSDETHPLLRRNWSPHVSHHDRSGARGLCFKWKTPAGRHPHRFARLRVRPVGR
jgi:hypothetical protein